MPRDGAERCASGVVRTILGLTPPWKVAAVVIDVKGEQVTVKVDGVDLLEI